ncbi:TPA: Ig-like domain-containing protein, partial [Enterobacter roggenkampii]
NATAATSTVTFVADTGTGGLDNPGAGLETVINGAQADGSATNSVKATVTDAHGNPLAGQAVTFAADGGAVIAESAATGTDGSVTVTLTSTKAGPSTVTATV